MRRAKGVLATIGVLVLLAWRGSARAEAPTTQLSVLYGLRWNTGELRERYAFSYYVIGVEAAYFPRILGQNNVGLSWSIRRNAFDSSSPTNVESELILLDMGLDLRARVPLILGPPQVVAYLEGGPLIVRTDIPIPPSSARSYLGFGVGAGIEYVLAGRFLATLGGRFGALGDPSGLMVFLSLGLAAR
ncbi:MAG: hypothetical protein HY698_06375 [Deltaproteobacteria bacterium]|nr:hypothetical protein [Deltaproteobacteria bacterium]